MCKHDLIMQFLKSTDFTKIAVASCEVCKYRGDYNSANNWAELKGFDPLDKKSLLWDLYQKSILKGYALTVVDMPYPHKKDAEIKKIYGDDKYVIYAGKMTYL